MDFKFLQDNVKHEFALVPRDDYKLRFLILVKDMKNCVEKSIDLLSKYDSNAADYYKKLYDYFIENDYLYLLMELYAAINHRLDKVMFKVLCNG